MARFDLAIIGCGGVSRMHLEGYLAHPERVRVVAVCDLDAKRVHEARSKYDIRKGYTSLDDLISKTSFDLAIVCTPTPVREKVISSLAAARKHIFCEKPLADSYAEAKRIVMACEKAAVQLAVNQNFRYHYTFEMAREIVQNGAVGEVVGVIHQDLMFRQDAGWRTECRRHALSVMGVHWLDGFRWMLGSEATSVSCQMRSSPAINCAGETDAHVQIAFGAGTLVSYIQSFSTPHRKTETVVIGDSGMLTLDYEGLIIRRPGPEGEITRVDDSPLAGPGKPESAFRALNELLTALESGEKPSNSGRDNLKTIALLEAAYRSADQGGVVELANGELR
jgi:predicted dehydrogenase